MFYNNVFLKNITTKNIKFLSIRQLYVLYKLLGVANLKGDLNKSIFFYVNIYLMLLNFNFSYKHSFLALMFFNKTGDVFFVSFLKNTKLVFFNKNNLFSFFSSKPTIDFNFFWKKWKNLKRPVIDSDFSTYYLDSFKKKLNTYATLGFVGVYNTYILVKSNKHLYLNNLVNITKPLLITPKYSSSTIHKHLSISNLTTFEFQFLRKNKVYNKGRYSRTRQNYRTGVYLCMYLSVLSLFGLYYWFYKFSFNFTYIWWFFIAFVGSFFLPKIIKYRLYEPTTLVSKFFDFFRWFNLLVKSLFF